MAAESVLHPVDQALADRATFGERAAERMASVIGSWRFLIIQSVLLIAWITVNAAAVALRWDAYPFILLNLGLSMQAAMVGPVLLIASNRASQRSTALAQHDYEINATALEILREVRTLTSEVHALTVATQST